jgi:hypothetical protein
MRVSSKVPEIFINGDSAKFACLPERDQRLIIGQIKHCARGLPGENRALEI